MNKPAFIPTLLKLAAVATIFYLSYGLTNHYTASRANVPEIAYAWEHHIPFLPWTIIPYWSLNLFYGLGFFLCTSTREQHRYIAQLLAAQAIAISGFLLFPLQISWAKDIGDGLFAALFRSLAAFDQAYNEMPSLHIILTLIIGRFYWSKLLPWLRPLWFAWCLLIGASVLTTYQHHFIDIPTALLAGALILWALPWQGTSPLRAHEPMTPRRRRFALLYLALAILIALPARWGGVWLWLLWPATSCLILAAGHARLGAAIWQKQADGRPTLAARLLLTPLHLAYRLNQYAWLRSNARGTAALTSRLHLGSILAADQYHAVVDTCAECSPSRRSTHYHSEPMLDMTAPDPAALNRAATAIEAFLNAQPAPVLICCALGYGRSVAAVLVWLVRYGGENDVDSALRHIRRVRTLARLPEETRIAVAQALENAYE